MSPITVFCLVYDDPLAEPFEVKIDGGETISALKDVIKEKQKPVFDHLPANYLRLWKVEIPITDEGTSQIPELNNKYKLGPAMRIDRVFPAEPREDHIHVIIGIPCQRQCDFVL